MRTHQVCHTLALGFAVFLAAGFVACGMAEDDAGAGGSTSFDPNGGGGSGQNQADAGTQPEPEFELPLSEPQAGVHFVYLTDSSLDSVVRIAAESLTVDLIEVGQSPDVLTVIPGTDDAVVLSSTAEELSLIRTDSDGNAKVTQLRIGKGYNTVTLGPDGKSAILWFRAAAAVPVTSLGPLQSITLLRMDSGKEIAIEVSVGFEPQNVVYSADGATAYVITRDSITPIGVATVTGAELIPPILLSDGVDELAVEREVQITPDGTTAIVRVLGKAELRRMWLDNGETQTLALPGEPTDLDLLPDGTIALVVLKSTAQLALVDLVADWETGSVLTLLDLPQKSFASAKLNDDGTLAILSTTDSKVEQVMVLNLETQQLTGILLQKPVQSVAIAPDGEHAVVVHQQKTTDGGATPSQQVDQQIDGKPGYSIIHLPSSYVKLFVTDVPVTQVAFAPEMEKVYVLLPGSGNTSDHQLGWVELGPLLESRLSLVTKPIHLIPVSTVGRMAISQEHSSGRITFVDTTTNQTQTITGFELNGLIN